MVKNYILAALMFCSTGAFSQISCGDTFTDSGGNGAEYSNDEQTVTTICPNQANQAVSITFTEFATESGYDSLIIYNGNSTSSPILGSFQGTDSPGTVVGSNPSGCLTFEFISDGSVTDIGWTATIACIPAITCFTPSALSASNITGNGATITWTPGGNETQWIIEYGLSGFTPGTGTTVTANSTTTNLSSLSGSSSYDVYVSASCSASDVSFAAGPLTFGTALAPFTCGNAFVDNGGPTGNYTNNSADTTVICRNNANETLIVDFTAFETEAGYDSLTIYEGNSTAGTFIGSYQDTISPGTITSTSGCLTFVFVSDGSVTRFGWTAQIICSNPAELAEKAEESTTIYPVPAQNLVNIENAYNEELTMSVVDINGRVVLTNVSIQTGTQSVSVENLENGVYVALFKNASVSFSKQIIIQH